MWSDDPEGGSYKVLDIENESWDLELRSLTILQMESVELC